MQWKDRYGNTVPGDDGKNKLLRLLYNTAIGRIFLKYVLIRPWVSKTAGWLMDSRISTVFIKRFVKNNDIDMSVYENRKFSSFNDFFTRRLKPGARAIDMDSKHLIAPCDSKLTAYTLTADSRFTVKNTEYTLESLLRDKALAQKYLNGQILIFRLTVGDYHRYIYPADGHKSDNIHIKGFFHTVNPLANDVFQIYKENTREYTILENHIFGSMLIMEVGATMVGRIVNEHGEAQVKRGEEKGRFEFGGSTVIVCLEKGKAIIDGDVLNNTVNGIETVVKIGEKIGIAEKEAE